MFFVFFSRTSKIKNNITFVWINPKVSPVKSFVSFQMFLNLKRSRTSGRTFLRIVGECIPLFTVIYTLSINILQIQQFEDSGIDITVMTADLEDNSYSHFGTSRGEMFIAQQESLMEDFLEFCSLNSSESTIIISPFLVVF